MPLKDQLYRLQPVQLYIVLVLSICYFSVQLVLSHITHALTLLMASYHMLCNIFALAGCILTIKHSKRTTTTIVNGDNDAHAHTLASKVDDEKFINMVNMEEQSLSKIERREMKLRNTFGWTRIDILTMLIVCVILASLSFSLLIEALQTLVHIDHQDTMHLPIPVMILSFIGLVLNGLCYLLIGGYTMHQGSFLHVTPSGDVILDSSTSRNGDVALKADNRQLSRSKRVDQSSMEIKEINAIDCEVRYQSKRQGILEMFRDVSSTIFVIICSIIVYLINDEQTAKYIDPILSIFSCVLLVSLSYPYMKESCLILLQTIPGSIDMEIFERTLVLKFPEIISYHDLHIWQLSANKYVSTVHIKFQSPKLYAKIIDDVRSFFVEQGITIVTIQPEFHHSNLPASLECLVQCQAADCLEKVCCRDSRTELQEINIDQHQHKHKKDAGSKLKELKISSLLQLNKLMDRSQSANNLSNGAMFSTSDCMESCNGNVEKSASNWQLSVATTKDVVVLDSSDVSLNPDISTNVEQNVTTTTTTVVRKD